MSSTALQTPTGLPTSNRHYTSHSPTPEGYYASQQPQHQVSTASSTSSSRPSRKSSAGGQSNAYTNSNSHVNNTSAYPNSPAPISQTNSPMSSRVAVSSPVVASAAATSAAASMSEYPQASPSTSERRRHAHGPPVAPPRTSSNRHDQQASITSVPPSSSGTRRSAAVAAIAASTSDSPRRQRESRSAGGSSSRDESSRRRQQQQQAQSGAQEYAQRATSSSTRAVAGAMPIRTHVTTSSAGQTSSRGPSRENSEILNAMVVTRDEVDVERERTRLAMAHLDQEAHAAARAARSEAAAPPPVVSASHAVQEQAEDSRRSGRSRHDYSKREKQIKFGEYILGNTIGEGEFGKVKLGWKQEGGVQVAIKLIKKDTLGNNPTRMAKIMREVNILRQLNHPNIVQLHKMEESEHHYGIVLEYASGGELFDYILKHRYLKDPAARRLFAQLISGVGYLHKKGIVHRDLKLENLLLDRNRNIIITDFGFANTFDPTEELTEEEEANLADRDWVKRMGFDRVKANGMRKADLMQTSCGSPCYAAPELVVSDSLYTGCKVDVWSCGVILYAMLAGYLPFDDDPKNPEGDNINLLYKYIVNTPLTFPEYVTPHARDLLRRILVPNPRERADLFEVARHSWLSEYANIVEFITSSTTSPGDIQNIPVAANEPAEGPMVGRSASVRESSKKAVVSPTIGGLVSKQGTIDQEAAEAAYIKQQKENKRRTVQVEYVAPSTQTHRGEVSQTGTASAGKTRARSGSQGPVAVAPAPAAMVTNKPLPKDPPVTKAQRESRRPPSAHRNASSTAAAAAAVATVAVSSRSHRDGRQEVAYMSSSSGGRPVTGGSIASTGSRAAASRASFGQPVPPTVAGTNAHGRIQQPTGSSARNYALSGPMPPESVSIGRPSISVPSKLPQTAGENGRHSSSPGEGKGHRRSNTLGDITDKLLGRSGSLFGGKGRKRTEQRQSVGGEKLSRRYPPVSMSNTGVSLHGMGGDEPRASMESIAHQSRRSFSIGLGKKRSGSIDGSQASQEKTHTRRFSLLPGGFSLKAIGINKDYVTASNAPDSQQDLPMQDPPQGARLEATGQDNSTDTEDYDGGVYAHLTGAQQAALAAANSTPVLEQQVEPQQQHMHQQQYQQQQYQQQMQQQQMHHQQVQQQQQQQQQRYTSAGEHDRHRLSVFPTQTQTGTLYETADNVHRKPPQSAPYQTVDKTEFQSQEPRRAASRSGRVVLQKNKRLVDAYDTDEYAKHHDRSGSSGAARRVMDFFRRRSKVRGGED